MITFPKLLALGSVAACYYGASSYAAPEHEEPDVSVAFELTPVTERAISPFAAQTASIQPKDIDLALCLDTSGSMQGLIDSAKQRLWSLVNELAFAEPTPRLRVALYTYGTPAFGEETGYVKLQVPLTEDLDMVSLKLFELSTNGGDEYVARVTQTAATQLEWSKSPKALKMIVVAGNETAELDPQVSLELACQTAIEKGIVVNTLYCAENLAAQQCAPAQTRGNALTNSVSQTAVASAPQTPAPAPVSPSGLDDIARGWRKVSQLADGAFAIIDQKSATMVIETPFDDPLAKLSTELNDTYIPYGSGAAWNMSNQQAQDLNAAGLNCDAAAGRAQAKAGKLYVCSWDLIDSLKSGQMQSEEIETEQLPEALRSLTQEELAQHIEKLRTERERIQAEITRISSERDAWLITKRTELGADDSMAFDSPLRKAFRELAEARGFRFPGPKTASAEADVENGSEAAPVSEVPPTESSDQNLEGLRW